MKPIADSDMTQLVDFLEGRDEFVFLDTARVTETEHRSLLFLEPRAWLICTGATDLENFLAKADRYEKQGLFLAGWFSYEFGYLLEPSLAPLVTESERPLAVLGVFASPLVLEHGTDAPLPFADPCRSGLKASAGSFQIGDIRPTIDEATYLAAVDRIKEYIVAGDTYQVNYTFKLRFSLRGSCAGLYRTLRRNQAVSYGAWIRQGGSDIMSFSPELFFRTEEDRITVRPMKGTMARGRTRGEDRTRQQALREDLKNRSENVMIVDLLRNDLGRLLHDLGGGRVVPRSLFDVEVYDSLLQMTSTVDGLPGDGCLPGLTAVLKALFPCGSVTGAPKIRTMEIIRELETEPRGVYCGAIGYSGPEGAVFNVPIRTVALENGTGEMGIGSGIIHDSDPAAEWRESLLKARFLTEPRPEFQLIETLLWRPGSGYWLLEEHLDRLRDSAAYFLFTFSGDAVRTRLARAARSFVAPMRVRLLLHTDGSLEINSTPLDPAWTVRTEFRPDTPVAGRVAFAEQRLEPDDPFLYHKTTRRSLFDDRYRWAREQGLVDVLFLNTRGEVTEGCISNVFVQMKGSDRLLTPPLRSGLLAGTFRRFLLDRDQAVEKVLTRDDLGRARAVYIGNSVRGLLRVETTW